MRRRRERRRKMKRNGWVKEFPGVITVCDREGIMVEMNDKAVRNFEKMGGSALLGSNILDCHPEPARTKLEELMQERRVNIYTVEKDGVRKLICQAPWMEDGEYLGYVEVVVELPEPLPHFVRQQRQPDS